jgi:N-acetylglucosaminyldiphosphoundecaprenol N-acetyl-beta-D-mannosaminyltransferase
MPKAHLISAGVNTGTFESILEEVMQLPSRQSSSYVCFANAHMIVEAHRDPAFRSVVQGADMVSPDGRPLSIFLKFVKGIETERAAGMDLLPELLRRSEARKKSVLFYGSTDDVLQAIAARIKRELPNLRVAGMISPPFRALSSDEKEEYIRQINAARPDYVLVSLGCPKQENWMAEHKGKIQACMLGLGQAFRTYAGVEKRLPKWMRDLSLEWVYRLSLEPGRLWKRYLVTNTTFLWLVIRHLLLSGSGSGNTDPAPAKTN